MSTIPEFSVATWKDFTALVEHLSIGDVVTGPAYIFRGHENADWRLEPSLHRSMKGDDAATPSAPEMLKVEAYLLGQFCAVAPTHLPAATFSTTRAAFDWWPIMRHYGVPTRILDWTDSIYVAAYFAVSRLPKCDGAIYVLHPHTLGEAMRAVHGKEAADLPKSDMFRDPDAPHAVYVFGRTTAVPERISIQQGCFMVCRNVAGDLENILATEVPKVGNPATERLRKLRIPAPSKPRFMTHLRAMNVTARSLFPGLDGMGRHLDETIRYR